MSNKIEKISFGSLIITAGDGKEPEWEEAVIVFTASSFDKELSEEERSYKVYSDCKYFNSDMGGRSLFGYGLDGTDQGIRLDHYIHHGGWTIDYCYVTKKTKKTEGVVK